MAKTILDSNEKQNGQDQTHDLPATGHIDRSSFQDDFATVDTPHWQDIAKLSAFMEEPVEVVISDSDAQNAEQIIQLSVNGRNQFLFRGIPTTIKRKFVEVLARSRPEVIGTQEYTDACGNLATRITKHSGSRYPFRILHDSNSDGLRWVESLLKEAS